MDTPASAPPQWASEYFGPLYHDIYSRFVLRAGNRTATELAALRRLLDLRRKRVLDVAAGFGRHSRPLARNNEVYALDLNRDYLVQARGGTTAPRRESPAAVRADMLFLPFHDGVFDAALLLFNSFGYARGGGDADSQLLGEIARVLRPGGGFVMETANKAAVLRAVRENPRARVATAEYDIAESWAYDRSSGVLTNCTEFRMGRRTQRCGYRLKLHTPGEVCQMLRQCGFRIEGRYGGYQLEPFDARASDTLLVHAARTS